MTNLSVDVNPPRHAHPHHQTDVLGMTYSLVNSSDVLCSGTEKVVSAGVLANVFKIVFALIFGVP